MLKGLGFACVHVMKCIKIGVQLGKSVKAIHLGQVSISDGEKFKSHS